MFDATLNAIFQPAINISPLVGLIVVVLVVTLLVTLINKRFTNQTLLKALKEETSMLQKDLKKEPDSKKKGELQARLWDINMQYLKNNFKAMFITFLPIVIIFSWLTKTFATAGKFFFGLGWFGGYIILFIIFTALFKKILKVY